MGSNTSYSSPKVEMRESPISGRGLFAKGKILKGELVVRIGRFGKFISCSRFPDCKFKERYIEKIGVKCEECKKGDVIVRKTKTGRKFYGCSKYPKCRYTEKLENKD